MLVPVVLGLSMGLLPAGGSRQVVDGAGRAVVLPAEARRIVSLAPSVTEILFALGAGDRVAGVTTFCDHPPEAASLPKVGGLINPDLERIVSLKPDLALATTSGNYLDDAERIERLGIPVYTIDIPGLEALFATLEQVGEILGRREAGRELARRLKSRIEKVRGESAGRPPVRTLFVIEPDPLIVPGAGTFIGEALAAAGAAALAPAAGPSWAQLDLEQVIALEPELILTTEAHRAWTEGLRGRAEWSRLPAVASGRIFVISDAIQHPGPRMVDGVEEVAAITRRVRGTAP